MNLRNQKKVRHRCKHRCPEAIFLAKPGAMGSEAVTLSLSAGFKAVFGVSRYDSRGHAPIART